MKTGFVAEPEDTKPLERTTSTSFRPSYLMNQSASSLSMARLAKESVGNVQLRKVATPIERKHWDSMQVCQSLSILFLFSYSISFRLEPSRNGLIGMWPSGITSSRILSMTSVMVCYWLISWRSSVAMTLVPTMTSLRYPFLTNSLFEANTHAHIDADLRKTRECNQVL